jgi:type IV pilus assembly protein PilA
MTTLEWAIFLVISGILAAMALPSFIAASSKPDPLSEAKTYIGAIGRGQQAYFFENNKFTDSLDKLQIGIHSQTTNYNYSLKATKSAAYSYGIARNQDFTSAVGGVFTITTKENPEMTTITILCINDKPGIITPPLPILKNGLPNCGAGTTQVK